MRGVEAGVPYILARAATHQEPEGSDSCSKGRASGLWSQRRLASPTGASGLSRQIWESVQNSTSHPAEATL